MGASVARSDGRGVVQAVLGSRPPVVLARIVRHADRGGEVILQADRPSEGARQLKAALERILTAGINTLTAGEWETLFAPRPATGPDTRWPLLVRLAVPPQPGEGKLRDKFVALPDGTPFSMRLLLATMRGGRGRGSRTGLPFGRLPEVAKLLALQQAVQGLGEGEKVSPNQLAVFVERAAQEAGLPVSGVTGKDVTNRLFDLIRNNGGAGLLPELDSGGRGRKRKTPAEKGPAIG